jgi:hypothetical protein
MKFAAILTLALAVLSVNPSSAGTTPDGATIRISGSTNSAPYVIRVWSDGNADVAVGDGAPHAFSIDIDRATSFFNDVSAARANPGTPQHCMKSASFGTTTVVSWHGYASVDLQCPPLTPAVSALALDVRAIQASANADTHVRRLPLPNDARKIPTPSPEETPT